MRVRHFMALAVAMCATLAVEASPRSAVAVSAVSIDPRELVARKEFAAGKYPQSVEIFAQLFAETGDPVFLRNIARCYQKMRRPDEAISNFQEYLAKGHVSSGERAEISSYVREMEDLARQRVAPGSANQATAAAPTVATPKAHPMLSSGDPSREVPSSPAIASQPRQNEVVPEGDPRQGDTRRPWRVAGIATAVVGVALVGTGVAFGMAAHSAAADVSAQWDPGRENAGKRDQTLQWVGYGVGAAALATGGLLFIYGTRHDEPRTGVRLDAGVWPPALRMEARF